MSGGIAGDWSPHLEYDVAQLVRRHHRRRRCINCTREGCRVNDWANDVHRREQVVRILLSGTLPDPITVDDLRAALERAR